MNFKKFQWKRYKHLYVFLIIVPILLVFWYKERAKVWSNCQTYLSVRYPNANLEMERLSFQLFPLGFNVEVHNLDDDVYFQTQAVFRFARRSEILGLNEKEYEHFLREEQAKQIEVQTETLPLNETVLPQARLPYFFERLFQPERVLAQDVSDDASPSETEEVLSQEVEASSSVEETLPPLQSQPLEEASYHPLEDKDLALAREKQDDLLNNKQSITGSDVFRIFDHQFSWFYSDNYVKSKYMTLYNSKADAFSNLESVKDILNKAWIELKTSAQPQVTLERTEAFQSEIPYVRLRLRFNSEIQDRERFVLESDRLLTLLQSGTYDFISDVVCESDVFPIDEARVKENGQTLQTWVETETTTTSTTSQNTEVQDFRPSFEVIKSLPTNDEGEQLLPTDGDGETVMTLNEEGQPEWPTDDKGEAIWPTDFNGDPIVMFDDGERIGPQTLVHRPNFSETTVEPSPKIIASGLVNAYYAYTLTVSMTYKPINVQILNNAVYILSMTEREKASYLAK